MSSVSSSRAKKIDPLTKRVPPNPKYKHVKSGIDTGASITKYMEKLEDIKNNYRFRKNEIFKRMKVTTFVHLVIQVYQINQDEGFSFEPPDSPDTQRLDTADLEVANVQNKSPVPSLSLTESDFGRQSEPDTARSTLLSVARGIGELDVNQPAPQPPLPTDDSLPYLLLDIRETDDYNQCHIIGALNYPKSFLSRATYYESKEMLVYRNKAGKVIIIYDEDERIAPQVAETLVQRGYDNLFMLSGGMKVAYKVFPEGLFTGTIPPTITSMKARQMLPATQATFDQTDIDKLEMYLDHQYEDKSVGSRLSKASNSRSRMSDTSSVASRSSISSTSTVTSSRPPFR